MRYWVNNIIWDLDIDPDATEYTDALERESLPTSTKVDVDREDQIADALSDHYGWCVLSFEMKIAHLHTFTLMGVAVIPPEDLARMEVDRLGEDRLGEERIKKIAQSAIEDILGADDVPFYPRKGHRDTYALVNSFSQKGLRDYAERKLTEVYRRDKSEYIKCLERHTAHADITAIEEADVLAFMKAHNVKITPEEAEAPLCQQIISYAKEGNL